MVYEQSRQLLRYQAYTKDDLGWKTTLDGRRPWMEVDLRWKMTLDGRLPWMEDDLGWKTTLDRRQPWMVVKC